MVLHSHLVELGFPVFVEVASPGHLFLKVGKDGDVLGPLQGPQEPPRGVLPVHRERPERRPHARPASPLQDRRYGGWYPGPVFSTRSKATPQGRPQRATARSPSGPWRRQSSGFRDLWYDADLHWKKMPEMAEKATQMSATDSATPDPPMPFERFLESVPPGSIRTFRTFGTPIHLHHHQAKDVLT